VYTIFSDFFCIEFGSKNFNYVNWQALTESAETEARTSWEQVWRVKERLASEWLWPEFVDGPVMNGAVLEVLHLHGHERTTWPVRCHGDEVGRQRRVESVTNENELKLNLHNTPITNYISVDDPSLACRPRIWAICIIFSAVLERISALASRNVMYNNE